MKYEISDVHPDEMYNFLKEIIEELGRGRRDIKTGDFVKAINQVLYRHESVWQIEETQDSYEVGGW